MLKTESDGRMFPTTNCSETIVDCLINAANALGIEIRKKVRILTLQKINSKFIIQLKDNRIIADCILLATGSSTWGHTIAREFGHKIIEPVPSLFTFNVPSSPLLDLSGISVPNVILSLKNSPQKQEGPFLLTHWGFSGPVTLKLSAWAARYLYALDYKTTLLVNWIASSNAEFLYQKLIMIP